MITAQPRQIASAYDVVIIGAGPAGLAAALGAREQGAESVLIVDREREAGGILLQCIHSGFGLQYFKEEVTGPEYAERSLEAALEHDVDILTDAFVMDLAEDRRLVLMSPDHGVVIVRAGAVVLAMGARERTRGAIQIPGTRPAGVLTAGLAQKMVNLHGYLPGRRVVILGSGDIGLIMARRLTLEGVEVAGVFEIMPYANGLGRNIVQCLHDYDIPLHLSTTVIDIHGHDRVERVTVAPVDDDLTPDAARAWDIPCDTLLLSVGLIPENELSRTLGVRMDPLTNGPIVTSAMETSVPGVFAAGNVVHINDLADWVSEEAVIAGRSAARRVTGNPLPADNIRVIPGENVGAVVPQSVSSDRPHRISFRVKRPVLEDAVITLGDVRRRKVRALAPAEMATINIAPRLLESFHGDALRLDAFPAAEEG
ncbi:MAG: FAD-dependent oxidoreductase [Egibacteraceae bacterium]